jgi:uroporphyrin-III C-methyltransferase
MSAPDFSLGLRLDGRLAVVVGGGSAAVRRVAGLRAAGADVFLVAPEITASLADLASRGLIRTRPGRYAATDLDGAWLVFACAADPGVNAAVAADAERRRLWCVRADDAPGSARMPATARPVKTGAGQVSIVGAGPGDPGLITAAGLDRLRRADVVVTDRLVAVELLAELPDDVLVIDAAKVPRGPAMPQEDINEALIAHARAGRAVVRLKGGDPYVFGRGREEADACLAAGVPVEVIPGVTSAIAVPAAAGVPVTHRGLTQGFTVVSGHVAPDDPRSTVDWAALARGGTTLVLLMAVRHAATITAALLNAGLAGDTPAACVADGWTAQQRVIAAPLNELATAMAEGHAANPAVIVIGDTAAYATSSTGDIGKTPRLRPAGDAGEAGPGSSSLRPRGGARRSGADGAAGGW